MGIGFSLATLLGVTIVIVCEVVRAPLVYVGNNPPGNSLAGLSSLVLDVPTMSPLSGYLSPHDVIFSLDDFHIHTAEEWKQVIALLTKQTHMRSSGPYGGIVNVEKGYCVPRSLIEESTNLQFEGNRTICPSELIAFAYVTCLDVSKYNDEGDKNNYQEEGKKNSLFGC